MGFFGELKQDLSQVADKESKRETAAKEADKILSEAEFAAMDEASAADDSYDNDDDVAALLKDLVSGLGGEGIESPEVSGEGSFDVSDDLNSILAGLMNNDDGQVSFDGAEKTPASFDTAAAPSPEESAAAEAAEDTYTRSAPDAAEETNTGSAPDAAEEANTESAPEAAEDANAGSAQDTAESANTEPASDAFEDAVPFNAGLAEETAEGAAQHADNTSVISEGMVINGNIEAAGNLDVLGRIIGNVRVSGKLKVSGTITGDSEAKEVFFERARINGNVVSESSVKVGEGTVIVGNVSGFSAAIAGAVKGDIDVHGPVILDTTAIVKGNIRSKTVQINNGAALEGVCSQAYAEISPTSFFEEYNG